jgi:hypothetical protein
MSSVPEIEAAIKKLSAKELAKFRKWFEKFDAEAWDKKLEADVRAGRLDDLAEEALRDHRHGRTTKL